MSNQLNSGQFRCCFGLLHVKTACILIGTWHLVKFCILIFETIFKKNNFLFLRNINQVLNLFALTLLGIIAKNPSVIHHSDSKFDDEIDALPTPVSRNNLESDYYTGNRDHNLNYNDIDMVS